MQSLGSASLGLTPVARSAANPRSDFIPCFRWLPLRSLPRLAERFGLASASVLLGLIWGVWHLPQFFIRGGDSYQQSFPVFVLQVTAMSVAFAWLYTRTNGSLFLTMLLHAAINNSKDIVPSGVPGGTETFGFHASRISWIALALLWGCAAVFLLDMRKQTLGNTTNVIST
jgi:uncharacterized protein